MKPNRILTAFLLVLLLLAGCASAETTAPTETENPETVAPTFPEVMDVMDSVATPEAYLALAEEHPETHFIWSVPFSFGPTASDTQLLEASSLDESDLPLMQYLTELTELDLSRCTNWSLVKQCLDSFTGLQICYSVPLGEQYFPMDHAEEITLQDASSEELLENLPFLPFVSSIQLAGTLPDTETLLELKETFPHITFLWEFDFLGIPVNTMTESIDLSGTEITDTRELEALLPYFYQLSSVDLCDCGLDNETMAALNERHPGTQFVWKVKVGKVVTRTDAIYFMPAKFGVSWMLQEQTENLKYLTKLQVLDLGHYSGISDVSFLYNMPDLRVLSLNSAVCTDFTPIGACQNLEYFEVFLGRCKDLWPLVNCTSLKNLNISFMPYGDPLPLCQMTWLDRLWICGNRLSEEECEMIRQALPNTVIVFDSDSSTAKGWRHSPSYYWARDTVDMIYMTR